MNEPNWTELAALAAQFPKPLPRYCVVTPENKRRLLGDIPVAADGLPRIDVFKSDFGSIEIVVKPGQRMTAWFMSDPTLVRAYLTGAVSEKELEQHASAEAVGLNPENLVNPV